MTTYTINPERRTLHGHFSRDLPPVLSIEPGDTVVFSTLASGWDVEPFQSFDAPQRKFESRDAELDKGHALCGSVEIRGAEPGMVLEIDIKDVRPGRWGTTFAGGWSNEPNDRLRVAKEKGVALAWTLDPDTMIGRDQHGHTLKLRPFMGQMGMPPAEPGVHSTVPPRPCGGNIDCKELVAGTTLYLPIAVPGGLFSTGDGHAIQGDGESATTAIECPMERVELTFRLNDTMHISTPRVRTADSWLCLGFSSDLDEAAYIALEAMLDLMMGQYNLSRLDALALASLVVDLRVTQIVNQVKGVHAVLRDGAIW